MSYQTNKNCDLSKCRTPAAVTPAADSADPAAPGPGPAPAPSSAPAPAPALTPAPA